MNNNFDNYLQCTEIINFDDQAIIDVAGEFNKVKHDNTALIQSVYEFVRDEIAHSFDINATVVTCIASDVLSYKHGICYAKSILLAALLRYLKIPCGFGYQKLLFDDYKKRLVLHGYNFVFLKDHNKWIKLDARGNTNEINAQFSIDQDDKHLAYPTRTDKNERDENINHAEPKKSVIQSLLASNNTHELIDKLPGDF